MNKNVIIITTKNDEVISGKYVDENEKYIVLYSYNSYISIAKEDIETIQFYLNIPESNYVGK